jgi:hypothetical protein
MTLEQKYGYRNAKHSARQALFPRDFLPECHVVSTEIRERRRTLRYRKLLVRQNVQLRNKVSRPRPGATTGQLVSFFHPASGDFDRQRPGVQARVY